MRRWGLVTATLAPVVLIGGWTLAASLMPHFDSLRDTISALAERGAPHRWVMTTALVVLGLCHLGTATALRPARLPGRLVLALGGILTVGVAVFPQNGPGVGGSDGHHGQVATGAFVCLCVWPLLAIRSAPAVLSARVAVPAFLVLLSFLAWFAVVLNDPQNLEGLAERCAAGSQAVWPFVLAASLARRRKA